MKVGDKVEKIAGYKYPGIVVAKFKTIDNMKERFVVECTEPAVSGMLHIFREGQVQKIEKRRERKSARKWWPWGKENYYDA